MDVLNRLKERCAVLREQCDDVPFASLKAMCFYKGWWEESNLDACVNGVKFPGSLKDSSALKLSYYNFYNFYFGFETGQAVQMVFPVITGLWKDGKKDPLEEPYFPDDQFEGSGFYDLSLVDKHSSTLHDPEERSARFSGDRFADRKTTFKNAIKRVLDCWDTSKPVTQDIKVFQNMTAMLGLTLMQAIVVDERKLARSFHNKHFQENLHKLTKWPYENGYAVPHQICLSTCCQGLNKLNRAVYTMFDMILFRWRSEARAAVSENETAQAIIEEALLNATKFNGLGLIKLVFAAQKASGMDLMTLRNATLLSCTENTWKDILKFMKKYIEQERPGDTFYWARIVDDDYLTEQFNPKYQAFFAGIMVGISQQESFFKNVHWFKTKVAQDGLEYGKKVVSNYNKHKV